MSVWYLAHDNELLIDLDDAERRTKSGAPWIEIFFRRRLREAIVDGKLDVASVWLIASNSPNHYHAIVQLKNPVPALERLVWQLHLGSDLYRGRADLMRLARGFPAPSLLIRPYEILDFYRAPDRVCACEEKHVTAENPACEVWRELRGLSPWELFGRSNPKAIERGVKLPCGRVPLARILSREERSDDEQSSSSGGEKVKPDGAPARRVPPTPVTRARRETKRARIARARARNARARK